MSDDYLTLVFRQPISSEVQRVLASGEWSAASHSHAIHERDRYSALCDKWNAECDAMREDNKRLADVAQALESKLEGLIDAAQAVIDRWETPMWKDVPPTADYIYRLRDAVVAAKGEAE